MQRFASMMKTCSFAQLREDQDVDHSAEDEEEISEMGFERQREEENELEDEARDEESK